MGICWQRKDKPKRRREISGGVLEVFDLLKLASHVMIPSKRAVDDLQSLSIGGSETKSGDRIGGSSLNHQIAKSQEVRALDIMPFIVPLVCATKQAG